MKSSCQSSDSQQASSEQGLKLTPGDQTPVSKVATDTGTEGTTAEQKGAPVTDKCEQQQYQFWYG